jgi:hypothetical protein
MKLIYRLGPGPEDFVDTEPLTFENSIGRFRLDGGTMVLELSSNEREGKDVLEAIECFLRSWEMEAALRHGHKVITFESDSEDLGRAAQEEREADGEDRLVISWTRYPDAPVIRVTNEMIEAWERYTHARIGIREPLQSAAYYCLTVIERSAGGRREAARQYRIDVRVLGRLGKLTTMRGSDMPRKYTPGSREMSSADRRWIDRAIRLCFLQLGSVNAGATPDRLTLEDVE